MGYVCPVCGAEQADGVHLANHLGVTASLGREDHLEWLERHAPDWADCGPEELASQVVEYAAEVETPEFEADHGHDHGATFEDELARQTRQPGRGAMASPETTAETERVLEEARELTRRMYEDGDDADRSDGDENE